MWTEGSVIGTAEPSLSLLDLIETQLTAHPNWEKVEARTIGAIIYHVWMCHGPEDEIEDRPGNDFGEDFYLYLLLATSGTTTSLSYGVSEGYSPVNGQAIRPAPDSAAQPSADFSYGNGIGYDISNGAHLAKRTITMATVYDYWILTTKNGLFVQTRVGTYAYSFYAGLFETLMDVDPFPLIVIDTQNASSSTNNRPGFWTRHPNNYQSSSYNWRASHINYTSWSQAAGQVGSFGDAFHNEQVIGSRVLCDTLTLAPSTTTIAQYGFARGLYLYFMWFPVATGVTVGDTITVNGDQYHYMGNNSIWINKDAEDAA